MNRNTWMIRLNGIVLCMSLSVTIALLVLEGRWQDALPLHLCSVSALAAVALSFCPVQIFLDFLWYLGMPGALLAILFPAPAFSRVQWLMSASYYATHALILVVPVCRMLGCMRPRPGQTMRMMAVLLFLGAIAGCVNGFLGTDFLFLSAPPAAAPLESVFALGYPAYWLFLFCMMLALCKAMDVLAAIVYR